MLPSLSLARPAAICAALVLATSAHAQSGAAHDFDLPSQRLDRALTQLARQSGARIAFSSDLAEPYQAPALQGRFTLDEALQRLLGNSGLVARQMPGGSLTIVPAPSVAAPADGAALPAIQVTGSAEALPGEPPMPYAGGQVARGARIGLLGDQDVMDTPFSIVSFTNQTMENQQARTLADVLVNDPSVRAVNAHGSFYDDFSIRGFNVRGTELAFNGLFGLAASRRVATEVAERVEVVKGPGALLTGMSPGGAVGGSVNLVPKRAGDLPLTRITGTYQSDSQWGGHLDLGRRWGKDNQWGIRLNGVYRDGATSVDAQSGKMALGAMALDYRGEQLRASLDVISQEEYMAGPRTILAFGSALTALPPPPSRTATNYLANGYHRQNDDTVVGRVEYDFNEQVSVFAAAGTRRSRMDNITGNPSAVDYAGNFSARLSTFKTSVDTDSGEVGVRARFATGPVRHTLVASANALDSSSGSVPLASGPALRSNLYFPVVASRPSQYPGAPLLNGSSKLSSFAVADTLALFDERLLVTAGVRRQKVESESFTINTGARTNRYDEGATTPMFSVVYKPMRQLSIYGNYIEGLSQGASAPPATANAGEVFPPFKTKQTELGAKWDMGRMAATVSVFQIKRPGSLIDPQTNIYSFGGEQRHRGVELGFFGEVAPGLRMLGGAAWTDAEIVRSQGGLNEGNTAVGVPKQQYNLNVEWDVPVLSGLTLTARATYTGSQYVNASNTQQIPSWTRYDLGGRYATRWNNRPVVLRANIENLTDRAYWIGYGNGWLSTSMPRTLLLSASFSF